MARSSAPARILAIGIALGSVAAANTSGATTGATFDHAVAGVTSRTALASGSSADGAPVVDAPLLTAWRWPVAGVGHVVTRYRAPDHAYGAGHRGVDLAAAAGTTVFSPADGTVVFVGTVVDRSLITIDHGDGYVTTLEPVSSALTEGTAVSAGDAVGTVSSGGHTASGSVHWGVRLDQAYIDPTALVPSRSQPRLLPCCD